MDDGQIKHDLPRILPGLLWFSCFQDKTRTLSRTRNDANCQFKDAEADHGEWWKVKDIKMNLLSFAT
jgi:hypothetical protein